MSMEIRALSDEDGAASWSLESLAFGYQAEVMPDGWSPCPPGRNPWGAFDATTGPLLAKAVDLEQAQWFGGRLVPAAGVAVAAESRGGGLGRLVLTHLLAAVRERGALISTLFNTTPWPYRRLGWEEVGALTKVSVPTMISRAGASRPGCAPAPPPSRTCRPSRSCIGPTPAPAPA